MSFDMKYNKNGDPVTPAPEIQPEQPQEQPAQDIVQEPLPIAMAAPEIPKPETPKAPAESWKELRDAAARMSRERDEALRRLQELEAVRIQNTASQSAQPPTEDSSFAINDTDIAEGKHLKSLYNEIKNLKNEIKNYKQQSTSMSAEARIRAQFPDFEKVVSADNVKLFRDVEPELAASLAQNTDPYLQAASVYKAIKRFGIYQEDTYAEDRERALKNATKPRPLTSISPQQGESPLTQANAFANGLTDELKSQLLKEMAEARKNR